MRRTWTALALAVAAAVPAGCGSSEDQAANEPRKDYRLEVVSAEFPERQDLAQRVRMRIQVLNAGTSEVPNVAVTLKRRGVTGESAPSTFSTDYDNPGLADKERPVWVVDSAPTGGDSAYASTWSLGKLAAGQVKTFEWQVTALLPGRHTVQYEVAAGLDGNARAIGRPGGTFTVVIDDKPADARVNGKGEVIRDPDDPSSVADDDDGTAGDAEPSGSAESEVRDR